MIIEASFEIISNEGLDGFSLSKLASKLGCTKSSLYNHFKNKDEILNNLFLEYHQRMFSSFKEIENPIEAYEHYVRYCLSNMGTFRFFYSYSRHIKFDDETKLSFHKDKKLLEDLIMKVAKIQDCEYDNFTIISGLLLGPIFSVVMRNNHGEAEPLTEVEIDLLISSMLRSIRKEVI